MKRFICSILLFLALTSQIGTYVVYVVQENLTREMIAQQIAQKLPTSALVKIKNTTSIEWEEEGKEFYVGGNFYDVVKTERNEDETWFYCINDTMQTQLYHNYTSSLQSPNDTLPFNKSSKQILKFSLSYFLVKDFASVSFISPVKSNPNYLRSQSIITIVKEVQAPPPRYV